MKNVGIRVIRCVSWHWRAVCCDEWCGSSFRAPQAGLAQLRFCRSIFVAGVAVLRILWRCLRRYTEIFVAPGAQVDHLAALAAKRAKNIAARKGGGFAAGGALDDGCVGIGTGGGGCRCAHRAASLAQRLFRHTASAQKPRLPWWTAACRLHPRASIVPTPSAGCR